MIGGEVVLLRDSAVPTDRPATLRRMLGERLANRMRHLAKWGRRQGISCFRLYERDVPEYPAIVDWYADVDPATGAPVDLARAGDAVAWPPVRDYRERILLLNSSKRSRAFWSGVFFRLSFSSL